MPQPLTKKKPKATSSEVDKKSKPRTRKKIKSSLVNQPRHKNCARTKKQTRLRGEHQRFIEKHQPKFRAQVMAKHGLTLDPDDTMMYLQINTETRKLLDKEWNKHVANTKKSKEDKHLDRKLKLSSKKAKKKVSKKKNSKRKANKSVKK